MRYVTGIVALSIALAPLAAAATDVLERIPAAPGGTLRFELESGSVEIASHDENDVRIDARASRSMDFEIESDGSDVRVKGDVGSWLPRLLGDPRVRVRLRVPSRYSVDVRTQGGEIELIDLEGSVRAESSGGRIEVERIAGDVEIRTSGGPIEASRVRGDLRAETSGGPIRVVECEGDIEVKTSGGPISVFEILGRVRAETSGGPVSVRFRGAPGGDIETSGGRIEVEFPGHLGADVDAETSGGRVRIEPEVAIRGRIEPSRIEGELNGGGDSLKLRTSGGEIRVLLR